MKGLVSKFHKRSNAVIASFNYRHKHMSDLYVAWRKVIRCIFRVPYRTHDDIVYRRLTKLLFNLINHDNPVVQNITKLKLGYPRSTLAENYTYLFYKFSFRLLYRPR